MTLVPKEVLEYYTRHSLLSNPGPDAHVLEALPSDLGALHHVINGLFIHVWKVRKYDPERLGREPHAVFVRSVPGLLRELLELSGAPFDEARPPHERIIIDCRSFALILCAVLRQRGVPARVRCGFASYLEPTHAQDHWICEYWNGERWVMEDPDVVRHDLSADDFVSGARAWGLVRRGEVSAERFGYGPSAQARGLWAVRINLLHDVAALCGAECVSGDSWGFTERGRHEFPEADLVVMDEAAQNASADAVLPRLWHYYASEAGLEMPPVVKHYDYLKRRQRFVRWRETPW